MLETLTTDKFLCLICAVVFNFHNCSAPWKYFTDKNFPNYGTWLIYMDITCLLQLKSLESNVQCLLIRTNFGPTYREWLQRTAPRALSPQSFPNVGGVYGSGRRRGCGNISGRSRWLTLNPQNRKTTKFISGGTQAEHDDQPWHAKGRRKFSTLGGLPRFFGRFGGRLKMCPGDSGLAAG